jgi:hypothetical protein
MKFLRVLTFISLVGFICVNNYVLEVLIDEEGVPVDYVSPYDSAPEVNEEGKVRTFRNGMLMYREPCEFDYSYENLTEAYHHDPITGKDTFVWKD